MSKVEITESENGVIMMGKPKDQIVALSARADRLGVPIEYFLYVTLLHQVIQNPLSGEVFKDDLVIGLAYIKSLPYKKRLDTLEAAGETVMRPKNLQ